MKNTAKVIIWLNSLFLVLFITSMTYLFLKYAPYIIDSFKEADRLRGLLASYGSINILVFIFFQIMQVIIAAIPGELVQLAGGYVYGTFFGTIYSTLGILLGSVITFYISRILGLNIVKAFVSPKNLQEFALLINSPKSEVVLFLLFLIPGIPKDALVYIAGLTPIKLIKFLIISAIARFPGILASSFVGAHIQGRIYISVIAVLTIVCILLLIGFLKRKAIVCKLLQHPKSPPSIDDT